MAQLDGKQLKNQSVSLNKLNQSGVVTFNAGATMSFGTGAALQTHIDNINTASDVVNKEYVDAVASGLDTKAPVKAVAATGSITLSGVGFQIDSYTVSAFDRILVAAQAGPNVATSSNGIYIATSSAWYRADDSDGNPTAEVSHGNYVFVTEGNLYEHSGWVLTTTDAANPNDILVGTDSQGWVQFSEATQLNAGFGLYSIGREINVLTGTGLTISGDAVAIADTTVTTGSYGQANAVTTFTVNAQGQLTAAATQSIDILSSQVSDFGTAAETVIFTNSNFIDGDTITFSVTSGDSVTAEVHLGSLTASRFNIINPASASQGWQLGYNNTGQFEWFDPTLVGDITEVVAGNGLTGGGTAGFVTLSVNLGVNSGLTFSADDIIIDTNIAGTGLDFTSGVLTVNTSEITSALAGNGLTANGGQLDVNVNSDSLEIVLDVVRLKNTITGDRTFQDSVTVGGNLTVNGTVSYIYTENLMIEDRIITLNATFSTGTPFLDAGIEVLRGSSQSAALIWDETLDLWAAGLSGSTSTLITEAGIGLTKSGNTLSTDILVNGGLTYSGTSLKVDVDNSTITIVNGKLQGAAQGILGVTAGTGLTGGGFGPNYITLDVNLGVNSGLTFSVDDIIIADTIAGSGLTFSAGVIDMVWGGTSSGLTYSSSTDSFGVVVDGTTITINSLGKLEVIAGSAKPVYQFGTVSATTGNDQPTILLSSNPNDYSRIEVFVNGQRQRLGNGVTTSDCYISATSGVAENLENVVSGQTLYWNGAIAGFDLEPTDVIELIYEA